MPKLPDLSALGQLQDLGNRQRPIATYDTTAIGKGAEALGQGVTKLGQGLGLAAEQQDKLDEATADADFRIKRTELYGDHAQDGDYATAPDRYRTAAGSMLDETAATIQNGYKRELFRQKNRAVIEGDAVLLQKNAVDQDRASTVTANDQRLDDLIKIAAANPDEKARSAAIENANKIIQAEVEAGLHTPAQAATRKRQFVEKYATAFGRDLVERDPEKLLEMAGKADEARKSVGEEPQAVIDTAGRLGISPRDLAAAISYETGGRFDPNIVGGKNNNYRGLIQFGPAERAQYGVKPGQTFTEQMGAVEDYLRDRGVKPGMGLPEIYSIINAGSLNRDGTPRLAASDGNGTVADHIDRIAADHYPKADEFLGQGGAKSGTLFDYIPAEQQLALRRMAETRINQNAQARDIDDERAVRQQERETKRASDQRSQEILQDVYSDNPQISVRDIVNDPLLTRQDKEHMIGVAGRANKPEPMAQSSAAVSMGLLDRMRKPEGDPERITDQGQIYDAMVKGDLTRADFTFLMKEFREGADGGGLTKTKKAFLASAKDTLDMAAMAAGSTQGGPGTFARFEFERAVDQKIEAYRKEGKNPANLFDPSNSDYLGKPGTDGKPAFIKPFLDGSLQKTMRERANQPATAPTPAPTGNRTNAAGQSIDEWLRARGGPMPAAPMTAPQSQ